VSVRSSEASQWSSHCILYLLWEVQKRDMTIQKLPMGKDDHLLHGLDPLKHSVHYASRGRLAWIGWFEPTKSKKHCQAEMSVGRSVKCVLWVRAEVYIGLQFIRRESR
jgi:hypothetical protein